MAPTDSSPPSRIPQLDGLRGIAIAMVLAWHLGKGFEEWTAASYGFEWLNALRRMGWSGVDLFFVLSGFLIGGLLIDHRGSANFFKVFYVRRACRILPAYFLFLLIFCLLRLGFPKEPTGVFEPQLPLWSLATFTQNITGSWLGTAGGPSVGITWSLAVEEQFYLIVPFIIAALPSRLLPFFLIAGIAAAPLCRLIILSNFPSLTLGAGLLTPCRADSLFAGVLGAWLIRQEHIRTAMANNVTGLRWILAILTAGVFLFGLRGYHVMHTFILTMGHTWLAFCYLSALLLILHARSGILLTICKQPALIALGQISYGVYLFHEMINGLFHSQLRKATPTIATSEGLGITLLALLTTVLFAGLSFRFFERPIIRYGHISKYQTGNMSENNPRKATAAV